MIKNPPGMTKKNPQSNKLKSEEMKQPEVAVDKQSKTDPKNFKKPPNLKKGFI